VKSCAVRQRPEGARGNRARPATTDPRSTPHRTSSGALSGRVVRRRWSRGGGPRRTGPAAPSAREAAPPMARYGVLLLPPVSARSCEVPAACGWLASVAASPVRRPVPPRCRVESPWPWCSTVDLSAPARDPARRRGRRRRVPRWWGRPGRGRTARPYHPPLPLAPGSAEADVRAGVESLRAVRALPDRIQELLAGSAAAGCRRRCRSRPRRPVGGRRDRVLQVQVGPGERLRGVVAGLGEVHLEGALVRCGHAVLEGVGPAAHNSSSASRCGPGRGP